MNDPPDHTAELSVMNLLSVGGITEPKYSLNNSSFSFNAVSVSLNTTPFLQGLSPCCDTQLLIRTVQIHQQGIFALLLGYLDGQMYV